MRQSRLTSRWSWTVAPYSQGLRPTGPGPRGSAEQQTVADEQVPRLRWTRHGPSHQAHGKSREYLASRGCDTAAQLYRPI